MFIINEEGKRRIKHFSSLLIYNALKKLSTELFITLLKIRPIINITNSRFQRQLQKKQTTELLKKSSVVLYLYQSGNPLPEGRKQRENDPPTAESRIGAHGDHSKESCGGISANPQFQRLRHDKISPQDRFSAVHFAHRHGIYPHVSSVPRIFRNLRIAPYIRPPARLATKSRLYVFCLLGIAPYFNILCRHP